MILSRKMKVTIKSRNKARNALLPKQGNQLTPVHRRSRGRRNASVLPLNTVRQIVTMPLHPLKRTTRQSPLRMMTDKVGPAQKLGYRFRWHIFCTHNYYLRERAVQPHLYNIPQLLSLSGQFH
jgi:hypothetical protein